MDAARLLQILPVEAAHRGSQSTQTTTTTITTTTTTTTASSSTTSDKTPQLYMLNIENENNQLRNNLNLNLNLNSNNNNHSFQVQTTVKSANTDVSPLSSISSQLISSMLQATNTNQTTAIATTTSTSTSASASSPDYRFNLPFISNFSTIDLVIVTVLITLILVSIIGNCLVCVAIFTDRRLRKLGNAFIVSLAIADLFVSCLVMTFALCNDLMNYWIFGDWFCDVWISFDIMCCTASILNLCAISLDRFIHIKDCLLYNQWMTKKVAISAVIIIWFISALVSFVPINLGWHKPDYRFGGAGSLSVSSPALAREPPSLPILSSHHNNQQQQQQLFHARYRRRAPNQQTTFDANFQLKHSMSIPSGSLLTSGFEKRAPKEGLLERGGTQQGAKLNYLSKHVKFPFPFTSTFPFHPTTDNNRREQTTTRAIEPIENQSSPYLATTQQSLGSSSFSKQPTVATTTTTTTTTGNDQLSRQDLSARFNRNGVSSQIINRRRQRDLVSGSGEKYERWHMTEGDGLAGLSSKQGSSSLKLPEIDSSGSREAATATATATNKNGPRQLQSGLQLNKVESNPLDRSQIELDPPKAWLLELGQEASRRAISSPAAASSPTAPSPTGRQVNLASSSPSAALKLSSLPELTDEADETTMSNNKVDLSAARPQLIILDQERDGDRDGNRTQEQDHSQILDPNSNLNQILNSNSNSNLNTNSNLNQATDTSGSAISDSIPKLSSSLLEPNNNIDNSNNPQLPLCILTLTPTYAVISSTISFYIPCIIMLGLYTKLFACARKHVRNIQAISKAPAPIAARTKNKAITTMTTTTTTTSQRSSPGTSDAVAQAHQLEQFENNNINNKGKNYSRCARHVQSQAGRHRRLPKIAMLQCGSLSKPASPMRTWLKFGREREKEAENERGADREEEEEEEEGGEDEKEGEVGGKVNEKYSKAQLNDKSGPKLTVFSQRKGAKELVVPNEVSPGNELVELARFTVSDEASVKLEAQQQQLSETSNCGPDNDLGSSEAFDSNDHQQQQQRSSPSSATVQKQQQQQQHHRHHRHHHRKIRNAEQRHSDVARRMQMPQVDQQKQPPEEKNGKNNSRKSLIGSENERIATLTLSEEDNTAAGVEEQLPFLESSREANNGKRTRSPKQTTCFASQLPTSVVGNQTTKMINFSSSTNFQQQLQQQQQQSGQQLATHKAAITLGIIMGTFLFCWVPFFCLNITKAFCVDCIPSSVFRFFTWLGYANSALNPIIYGIHNSEFRNAFNRIFFKHLNIKNSRYYLNRRFSFDLRQQSVHDHQKSCFQRKDRLKNNSTNNSTTNRKSADSKKLFKCCKAEALA